MTNSPTLTINFNKVTDGIFQLVELDARNQQTNPILERTIICVTFKIKTRISV